MTGPAPGWQPDPTGRHEYRYWDGTKWSDDVSDGGVTATDPVAGTPDATQAQQVTPDPQQPATAVQPGYQSGGYDPASYDSGAAQGYGAAGYQQAAGPQSGGQPGYGTGGGSGGYNMPTYGAQQPSSSSGPSTGLLVGLGILVVVLIAGIGFVLLGGDDKDDTETADPTTTTTAGTDTTDPVVTTEPPVDTTLGTDLGGDSAIVDAIAEGILSGSGGVLTDEEATCMANAMVDTIGVDRLIELGLAADESADPLGSLTTEEQDEVYSAMANCVDAETLGELGGL